MRIFWASMGGQSYDDSSFTVGKMHLFIFLNVILHLSTKSQVWGGLVAPKYLKIYITKKHQAWRTI